MALVIMGILMVKKVKEKGPLGSSYFFWYFILFRDFCVFSAISTGSLQARMMFLHIIMNVLKLLYVPIAF
jgi:uncharacterized membrane protein